MGSPDLCLTAKSLIAAFKGEAYASSPVNSHGFCSILGLTACEAVAGVGGSLVSSGFLMVVVDLDWLLCVGGWRHFEGCVAWWLRRCVMDGGNGVIVRVFLGLVVGLVPFYLGFKAF